MITWKYAGTDDKRQEVSGEIRASSEKDARRQLRAKGIRAKTLKKPSILEVDLGELLVDRGLADPFKKVELLGFTRQLGVMLDAGVPILQCLEILGKSQKNRSFKRIIRNVAEDVGGGKSLSIALEGKPGFDVLFINLIRAGEVGGVLGDVISRLVEFMEKQEKTKKAIKSAMSYPAIVIMVGVGVVYALMIFVIPKFTEIIKSSGQEVPAVTQFVIDTSNFIGEYALLMFVSGFIFLVLFFKVIKTKQGKPIFDKFMMSLPIFGNIIIKGNLASFTRTLGIMLNSGVSLVDALEICVSTIDNAIISKDVAQVRQSVTRGETMTDPISRIDYFPEMVAQMIKIGEQTGGMNAMLNKVSNIFEEDVDDSVSNMTKLIEPLVIVVLGGIIAVLLVAMYLPIFQSAGG